MARQYARRTFLRRTPNELLKQYFQQRQVGVDAMWDDLTETGIEPLDDALDALPHDVLRRVDGEFSQIMHMATAKGVTAILEEAASRDQDWSEQFAEMSNDYERAMWTFLNEPNRFIVAGAFHEMDRVTFSWHRFAGLRLEAQTEAGALDVFGAALAAHYRRQGRGRHCHVDVYRRVGPDRYCYFAYPEDAASTDLGYDEQGRFQRRPRQSAFEVIFVYRPEEGTTELYARGNKRQKEELAEIFCVNALGLKGLPDANGREPFNLAVLKDPTFTFPTDPRDRVQSVEVRLLRLDLPFMSGKGTNRRVLLEAKSTAEAPRALHGLIKEVVNPLNIRMDDIQIGRAKLCFTFRPVDNQRPKTLTFEVGYPDRCTLKDDPYDQTARKYLHEWGIASHQDAPVLAVAV